MNQQSLMELRTHQLLDKFGAGGHKPGSGSAAALMGLLSGKLTVTVGRLTLSRPEYQSAHSQVKHLNSQIAEKLEEGF